MKRIVSLSVITILLCGCATMTTSSFTACNRMKLVRLSPGMSKAHVLKMMGKKSGVYNCDLSSSKTRVNVTLNNPYRTEMIKTSGRTLEVVYYLTDFKNSNCVVSDDELTPFVFENNKLIGWGNNFLLEAAPELRQK